MTAQTPAALRPNVKFEHAVMSAWLDTSNVGLCVVDSTSTIVMLNRAACGMLGVDGLAMLGQPFASLLTVVKFQPDVVRWLGSSSFEGSRHASMTRGDAEVDLLLNASVLKSDDGSTAHLPSNVTRAAAYQVIAVTDVTELILAQRQVSSESFRRQWQALNAGVVISDARLPDMPIVYVNPMFETMSGYSSAEILGRNCRFLQGQEVNQPGLVDIRAAIASQSNGYAKLRNYRKDGSMFVNELFISPVKDVAGVVTHFVGIQHLETDATA